jgi:hypothetical protein
MRAQYRVYTMVLSNPGTNSCGNFHNDINQQTFGKKVFHQNNRQTSTECVVELKIRLWSCNNGSPNHFKRLVETKYPDVTITITRNEN